MLLDEYQKKAAETAMYPEQGKNMVYTALGLASEAGEVAGKVKKIIRDEGGIISDNSRVAIAKELGDVLWYAAQCATELNLTLSEVAKENITKLQGRLERGTIRGAGDDR
jgi:NTP pyrophosphatase (non-canonical NTP hydrolase)